MNYYSNILICVCLLIFLLCVLFSCKFSQKKVDIEFTNYKKDIESISLLVLQVTAGQSYQLIDGKRKCLAE